MAAVDWSHLPPELLETISSKLPVYSDYLHFRAVCRWFRSSIPKIPRRLPPQLPWLLLPADSSYSSSFNIQDGRVRNLRRSTRGPSPLSRRRCCGSSHGWLATIGESPDITLVNPLTLSEVQLPPLSAFPNVVAFDYANVGREYVVRSSSGQLVSYDLAHMRDSFLEKIVLSSCPAEDPEFAAMATFACGPNLAFCRSGDSHWTIVEGGSYCEDVLYRDGSFYTLNKMGQIAVISLLPGPAPSPLDVSFIMPLGLVGSDRQYLVFAGDDLLLVTRFLDLELDADPYLTRYRTLAINVHKLDRRSEPAPMWVRTSDVGDYMLFVGRNSSLALPASEFPGCAGNRIYFTDDYSEYNADGNGAPDIGIYSLTDGSIEALPCFDRSRPYAIQPEPIWLSPNPR